MGWPGVDDRRLEPCADAQGTGMTVGAALFMIIHFIHFSIHYYNDTT